MTRNDLIKTLTDRKMASADKNKVGCVPCLGSPRKDQPTGKK